MNLPTYPGPVDPRDLRYSLCQCAPPPGQTTQPVTLTISDGNPSYTCTWCGQDLPDADQLHAEEIPLNLTRDADGTGRLVVPVIAAFEPPAVAPDTQAGPR